MIGGSHFISYVADFNGDGYDDLLMAWSNENALPSNPRMVIATAVDVNDPTKGFRFGPIFSTASPYGIRQLTIGDFNGDGQPEIVQAYVDTNRQLTLATYAVDPATLTLSEGGQLVYVETVDTLYHPIEMTACHFTALDHQQLVVGAQLKDGDQVHMGFFDFSQGSVQPERVSSVFFDYATGLTLRLRAGRFNWGNPYDQIAWMSSSGAGTRLSVLVVDPQSQTVVRKADVPLIPDTVGQSDAINIGLDMAIGNFDNMQQGADGSQERNPDLQIALIDARANSNSGTAGTGALYIYSVSEDFSTLTQQAGIYLTQTFFGGNSIRNMSIARGDLQATNPGS